MVTDTLQLLYIAYDFFPILRKLFTKYAQKTIRTNINYCCRIYCRNSDNLEMGPIYAEWRATCDMTLGIVCKLLQGANPSSELVGFVSNHDIHPSVQKRLPINRVWWVDIHILAFLSVSHLLQSEYFLINFIS